MSLNIDLYKSRLNAYKVGSEDSQLDLLKQQILDDFESNPSHKRVKINDVDRSVIMVEKSSLNKKPDEKRILTKPGEVINQGDILEYKDNKWLCIDIDLDTDVYYRADIKYCNNTLKWQDEDDIVHQTPCILSNKSSYSSDELQETNYIVLSDKKISLTVKNDEYTSNIKTNKRVIFNNNSNSVFEIKDIDTLIQKGLIHFVLEKALYRSNVDNLEENLADYVKPVEPTPDISIIGDDSFKQYSLSTYTISIPVTWSVSNDNAQLDDESETSITLFGATKGSVILTADDGTTQYTKEIEVINSW